MLFEPQISRKPNKYPWTQDFIDAMWKGFWTPNEFNFNSDVQDFHTVLTPEERQMVVRCMSAIGQIEVAVKTFWANLGRNLPHPSMSDLGFAMANTEVIHNIAYEKLLERLGLSEIFEENLKNPLIAGRVKYLKKYLELVYPEDKRKQFIYALILFTLFVENVSLFSQFYIILWLSKNRNVLKDTSQQVLYTRNEEAIHAQVGIKIINTLREEYPELFDKELENRVREEAVEAFICESAIIDWMCEGVSEPGLDAETLKAFVANRINESLRAIGFGTPLEVDNARLRDTKWFDEALYAANMTDFFHKRPVEYAKKHKAFSAEQLF